MEKNHHSVHWQERACKPGTQGDHVVAVASVLERVVLSRNNTQDRLLACLLELEKSEFNEKLKLEKEELEKDLISHEKCFRNLQRRVGQCPIQKLKLCKVFHHQISSGVASKITGNRGNTVAQKVLSIPMKKPGMTGDLRKNQFGPKCSSGLEEGTANEDSSSNEKLAMKGNQQGPIEISKIYTSSIVLPVKRKRKVASICNCPLKGPIIHNPHPNDVILGNGLASSLFPQNTSFFEYLKDECESYKLGSEHPKMPIWNSILKKVANQEPPGRWLKSVEEGSYREVDSKASLVSRFSKAFYYWKTRGYKLEQQDFAQQERTNENNDDAYITKAKGIVFKPNPHDVILGIGSMAAYRPGDEALRSFLKSMMEEWNATQRRMQKIALIRKILDMLRNKTPPVRFLQPHPSKKYYTIASDRVAKERIKNTMGCLRRRAMGYIRKRDRKTNDMYRKQYLPYLKENRNTTESK